MRARIPDKCARREDEASLIVAVNGLAECDT